MRYLVLALVGILGAGVLPAAAQSNADFVKAFSGKWQAYEQRLAVGPGSCNLELSSRGAAAHLPLTVADCDAPLAKATAWSIEGSQMVLYDAQEQVLLKLGGNQKRITGVTADNVPIILERIGGDGTAATLQAAYNASGCYYLGYSQSCAPLSELAEPAPLPDGRSQIKLLTNLNVHEEPRTDALVVGTAQMGSCVTVDSCAMASDGPWCRAKFGQATGWLRKLTMRQNRWPVVTFLNACR